jgi:hypothetical protein
VGDPNKMSADEDIPSDEDITDDIANRHAVAIAAQCAPRIARLSPAATAAMVFGSSPAVLSTWSAATTSAERSGNLDEPVVGPEPEAQLDPGPLRDASDHEHSGGTDEPADATGVHFTRTKRTRCKVEYRLRVLPESDGSFGFEVEMPPIQSHRQHGGLNTKPEELRRASILAEQLYMKRVSPLLVECPEVVLDYK